MQGTENYKKCISDFFKVELLKLSDTVTQIKNSLDDFYMSKERINELEDSIPNATGTFKKG